MSINQISAQSFKGLWQVKTSRKGAHWVYDNKKTFVYHPFADEKVDTVDLEAKKSKFSGKYECMQFDDCDHEYPHTLTNQFVLGEPLSITAEKYFSEVKNLVKEFGKGLKFLETEEVEKYIEPTKTEFGFSNDVFDYSSIKKVN